MTQDRLLVVGASGFLGANLVLAARDDIDVVAHASSAPVVASGVEPVVADLRAAGSARGLVGDVGATLVVNCAALADVDRCEDEPDLGRLLNVDLPGELAEACARLPWVTRCPLGSARSVSGYFCVSHAGGVAVGVPRTETM